MAWIESHQSLKGHPKTRKFARLLGIPRVQAIGMLHCLWWWAVDAAPSGCLSAYTAEDIAEEMMYTGDPNRLIMALTDCGEESDDETDEQEPGFLEIDERGNFHIHDWHEFAGKLLDRRERDAARKRELRSSEECDSDSRRTIHGMSNGRPKDMHRMSRCNSNSDLNTPYSPPLGDDHGPAEAIDEQEQANAETAEPTVNEGEPRLSVQQEAWFDVFWANWPRGHKVAIYAAKRSFARKVKTEPTFRSVMAGLAKSKHSEKWQERGGKFIPHASTWLNQGRWKDEHDGDSAGGMPGNPVLGGTPIAHALTDEMIAQMRAEGLSH